MASKTLHLSRPFSKTLIIAFLIMGLLIAIGEMILRQQLVQAYLGTPSLNSRHRHLERQWYRLESLTKSGVKIDCIALGNSMILNSFDPQIFAANFESVTGETIRCFNFGVDALTPVAAEALAQILISTYHPRLLIFGTDARDFAIPSESIETTVFTDTAWLQYRLGRFNLEGWLIDHSYFYRYRYRIVDFLRLSFGKIDQTIENAYGFEPLDTIADVSGPPDPEDNAYNIQYYFRTLREYSIQPENTAALAKILEQETQVVVVEMPVAPMFFHFFDNPQTDYQAFLNTLKTVTANYHVLLLESNSQILIPDDGWMDYTHVNYKGAPLFSQWLGQLLGKAAVNGQLPGLLTVRSVKD